MGGLIDQYLLNSCIRCHPESLEDVVLAAEIMEKVFRKPSLLSRHVAVYSFSETIMPVTID